MSDRSVRADRQGRLRRFEACLRRRHGVIDARWDLTCIGMTDNEIREAERQMRRRIRSERTRTEENQ